MNKERKGRKNSTGGVRLKNGSNKLYIDFYYHGARVTRSTGLDDTPENRLKAEKLLDGLLEKKSAGTLVFAKAFPGASESEKAFHARYEGWEYRPEPKDVFFKDYVIEWKERAWASYRSEIKKDDYQQVLDDWLIPYFGELTFDDLTGVKLQQFIGQLRWRSGKNLGRPLSGSRVRNIMIPLRAIWRSARSRYRWTSLENPFDFLKDEGVVPKKRGERPVVFRFGEWKHVLAHLDPFYHPVAEIMVLTGMIGSELAGLRKKDIHSDVIHIINSVVPRRRGKERLEKEQLKTEYRGRNFPLTEAIRRRLDAAMGSSPGEYVFTMKDGSPFDPNKFRQGAWETAFRRAGAPFRKPYTTRHTFAAWALAVRISPIKLVKLMGHGSKQMVYEVYGDYVDGLEEDSASILAFFGEDFLATKSRGILASSAPSGESIGERSRG